MYRPEGMKENPYEAKPGNAADLDRMGREIAFEVGADAMLEGLKKVSENGSYSYFQGEFFLPSEFLEKKGYLVFIEVE